ncbi:hypothetical protein [Leptolyngbya ohadii]|uniref:hypothetical protein n=1 Tax=Leptolyngbya ohadii TaxID=1962290 RepID=UPI000B59F4A3|nr:hypothetical protein [Leptolyngbya ohadii]
MSSPFPPNALLTFRLPVAGGEIDALGNPVALTEDLQVVCYLKQGSVQKSSDPLDGGELARVALDGRIVGRLVDGAIEPLDSLPADILPGTKAEARIGRDGTLPSDGDEALEGDFFVEQAIASAFGVDAVLGGKIRGYLVMAVAWGEAL